jgi:hypothetical protein
LISAKNQPAATISFRNPLGNLQEFHENLFAKKTTEQSHRSGTKRNSVLLIWCREFAITFSGFSGRTRGFLENFSRIESGNSNKTDDLLT